MADRTGGALANGVGPPSGLRSALRQESDKQAWVDWVFSRVAHRYDLGNDLLSLGFHTHLKRRLVGMVAPVGDDRVLDIACGTGDITVMLAKRVAPMVVVGCDINPDMVEQARLKVAANNVRWVGADAAKLPFPDNTFDVITCAYAGRGFPDWPAVLHEVHRILKPGGRFVNLDFARHPFWPWDVMYRAWMTVFGAALGSVLLGDWQTYVYIPESIRAYAGQRWLDEEMKRVGFRTRLVETWGYLMAYNVGQKFDPSRGIVRR